MSLRLVAMLYSAWVLGQLITKPTSSGGGAVVVGTVKQKKGKLSCQACRSSDGGCLRVGRGFEQRQAGYAEFKVCSAAGAGGALSVEEGVALGGSSIFEDCTSKGSPNNPPQTNSPQGRVA